MLSVLWEKKATLSFIGNSTRFQHPIAVQRPKPPIFFAYRLKRSAPKARFFRALFIYYSS
jgi:hypothetical protein